MNKKRTYPYLDTFFKSRESDEKIKLLKLFDKDCGNVVKIPNELINTEPLRRYADAIYRGDNGVIYIIEYQNGKIKTRDLIRFGLYNMMVLEYFKDENVEVRVVIIYTEEVDKDTSLKNGTIHFCPDIHSLMDRMVMNS